MSDTSRKNFGTVTYPDTLPLEVAKSPLEGTDSVTRLYCKKCGELRELNEEQATKTLALAFPKQSPAPALEFANHYFLADGCPDCSETPLFTPVEIIL